MIEVKQVHASLVEVDGAGLYYEVAGDGPHLVLGHASMADRRMWDLQFATFSERYRVVRYDRRGFGNSTIPRGAFSHRRDLFQLLRGLGIDRAHLVGCAEGGATMIEFALEHPEMAASLVVESPSLGGYPRATAPSAVLDELPIALRAGDVRRAAEIAVRLWVDGPERTPDQVDARIRDRVQEMSRTALLNTFVEEESLRPPAAERLGSLMTPTLLLVGELDHRDVRDRTEFLRSGIAGARRVVLQGAAHLANMENPGEFDRVVLDFLDRQPA